MSITQLERSDYPCVILCKRKRPYPFYSVIKSTTYRDYIIESGIKLTKNLRNPEDSSGLFRLSYFLIISQAVSWCYSKAELHEIFQRHYAREFGSEIILFPAMASAKLLGPIHIYDASPVTKCRNRISIQITTTATTEQRPDTLYLNTLLALCT